MSTDPDSLNHEDDHAEGGALGSSYRPSRRAMIGAAAWSVPVVAVATAAPAFAMSGDVLTKTSPVGNFTADQFSTTQTLVVTLTTSTGSAAGRTVLFSVTGTDPGWLTFSNAVVTTTAQGVATTTLQYGANKPAPGTTYTIRAALQDDSAVATVWTVTYTPVANLPVVRVGTGAAALTGIATAVFLDTFDPAANASTAPAATRALPTTASTGAVKALTVSGSATSEGALALSADRAYLVLAGYNADVGTTGVANTTAAAVNRVVGRVSATTIDTSTALTDQPTGNNVRTATSVDGSGFFVGGGTGGLRYQTFGTTGTSTAVSTTVTNIRAVNVYAGQLYLSTGSGTAGVYSVGTGASPAAGQTATMLSGTGGSSPYAFVLLDRSNTVGTPAYTLYVADDTATTGGILKYSSTSLTGPFTARGLVATPARGVTATVSGDSVVLFATTSASTLVRVIDTAAYNANLTAGGGTPTVIATAANNTAFRGVAFAPSGA